MASSLPVRILVVDDSPIFLEAFSAFVEAQPDLTLIDSAVNGREAVEKVSRLGPDLVVMDVMMPVMDGLEAVEEIMSSRPTPILLITGELGRQGAHWSFEALSRGALELMPKPDLMDWREKEKVASLVDHLKLLASVPVVYRRKSRRVAPSPRPAKSPGAEDGEHGAGVLGIVASTGGPAVLAEVLGGLPADFSWPILIVQHLAEDFAPRMVSWLDDISPLEVRMAKRGEVPRPGHVYVAPDRAHLLLDPDGTLALDEETGPVDGHLPSGTRLLSSLATTCGRSAIGLVLTGMGADGARGLLELHDTGGLCLAQDEETSVVFGIAQAACALGAVDRLIPRSEIVTVLLEMTARADRRRIKA